MCIVGNSVHTQFVFQAHPYTLLQRERSLYTNKLSHRTVCKAHTWMTLTADPLQIPADSTVALTLHMWL
jgi:hypothetical protein